VKKEKIILLQRKSKLEKHSYFGKGPGMPKGTVFREKRVNLKSLRKN